MYSVRDAVDKEVFRLVEISERVLKESPTYTHMKFDSEKAANYIYGAIMKHDGWFLRVIVDENNVIAGGLICVCEPMAFSPDKVAYDITIMVEEEHRGRCLPQLVQVIEEYKVWAVAQGAKLIKMGVSSGISIDSAAKFFERLGFERIGSMHGFKVGE